MRYRFFLLFLGIMICSFGMINVDALEVENLNHTVKYGETLDIDLYVNVPNKTKKITFLLSNLNYDVVGSFESSIGVLTNDGMSQTISFDKPVDGRIKLGMLKVNIADNPTIDTSTINLYNANAVSVDGVVTKLNNQSIQVNIEKEKDSVESDAIKTNLLKSINSNIVDISLELNKYEYDVAVDKEIDELDLIAIPVDESYKIDISDQKIKDGINKIYITLSKDDVVEKYTINVIKNIESNIKTDDEVTVINKNELSKGKSKNFKLIWGMVMAGLFMVFIVGLCMLNKK